MGRQLRRGDQVRHVDKLDWGVGTVVSSEGSKVHVRFESGELRIFKGAPLERVAAGYSTGGRGRTGSLGSIRSSDDRMIVDCINLEKFDAEELVDEWRCCAVRKLTRNVPYPQTR